jgi:TldD protein
MISPILAQKVLEAALSKGGDFSEIFIEEKYKTNFEMIGGKLEQAVTGRDFGLGLRILSGTNAIYVHTNRLDEESLIAFARQASSAVGQLGQSINVRLQAQPLKTHRFEIFPEQVEKQKKVDLMRRIHQAASKHDPLITQVIARYLDEDQHVFIANSEGLMVEDRRVRTRLVASCVATYEGQMQTGSADMAGLVGFELYDGADIEALGVRAAEMAKRMAMAEDCVSGRFPVIIDNAFGGVIFHEACGHGLEAEFVSKKASVFCEKLGESIASPILTAIDDGTIANGWGSGTVDDEGHPTQRNILIENGILKSYLVDRHNGKRMNTPANGSSRRQSYQFAPTSRMSNTFIAPGKSTLEELIASVEFGLYTKTMGGGSVNTATGDFNFSAREAYLVRNGKIAEAVKGATLIGTGLEVLQKIDMIANNLDYGIGMCGASSGSIPTIVGQPAVRVSEMTVGGKREA